MKFNDPELIPDHCLSVAAFDRRTADRYARDPTHRDPKRLTLAPKGKRRSDGPQVITTLPRALQRLCEDRGMSYERVKPGDAGYDLVEGSRNVGLWCCDAADHNKPEGCPNPGCFKYRERLKPAK